jgi:hypothetical protein
MAQTFIDTITKGTNPCGFCMTGHHDTCKGVIRNGNLSLIQCACSCSDEKTQRCTECHSTNQDDLGRPWLCDDRDACRARIEARVSASPVQRKIKAVQEAPRPLRVGKTASACLCCGEPTKGGKFLPGHDSKWLNSRLLLLNTSSVTRDEMLASVAEVSPALADKLKKRIS